MPPTAPHAPRDLGPAPWAVVFDLDETLIVEERAVADGDAPCGVGTLLRWAA